MTVYTREDAARKGTITNYSTSNVTCFKKTFNNEELFVLVNLRNNNQHFSIPGSLQNSSWTNAISEAPFSLESTITLSNYQYLILKRSEAGN
jgi:hypothetical protein